MLFIPFQSNQIGFMKTHIAQNLQSKFEIWLANFKHQKIYNAPWTGKLGGWAFALLHGIGHSACNQIGVIETLASTTLNTLGFLFSQEARRDLKGSVKSLGFHLFSATLGAIGMTFFEFLDCWGSAAEDETVALDEDCLFADLHFPI